MLILIFYCKWSPQLEMHWTWPAQMRFTLCARNFSCHHHTALPYANEIEIAQLCNYGSLHAGDFLNNLSSIWRFLLKYLWRLRRNLHGWLKKNHQPAVASSIDFIFFSHNHYFFLSLIHFSLKFAFITDSCSQINSGSFILQTIKINL